MWFPTSKNVVLNALLIPVRLVLLIWHDFRCQWLNWHHYTHISREGWDWHGRTLTEWDQCTNEFCRVQRPGSWHRRRLEPGEDAE